MLPVRVLHRPNSQFFGFGPSSREIEVVTSMHTRGKEPMGTIYLFGHTWIPEKWSHGHGGHTYLTWKMVC